MRHLGGVNRTLGLAAVAAAAGVLILAAVATIQGPVAPIAPTSPAASPSALGTRIWLLTQDASITGCGLALVSGRLVADPTSGLGLETGNRALPVDWPTGFTAAIVGDRIALLDSSDSVVAREGDYLNLGGGLGSGPGDPWYACRGDIREAAAPSAVAGDLGHVTASEALSIAFRDLGFATETPVRVTSAAVVPFKLAEPGSGVFNADAPVWAFVFAGVFDVPSTGPALPCGTPSPSICPPPALSAEVVVDPSTGAVISSGYPSNGPLPTNPWWFTDEVTTCGFPAIYRLDANAQGSGLGSCAMTLGYPARPIRMTVGDTIDLHMTQDSFGGPPVFPVPVSSDDAVLSLVTEGLTDGTFRAVAPGTALLLSNGDCGPGIGPWQCPVAVVEVAAPG